MKHRWTSATLLCVAALLAPYTPAHAFSLGDFFERLSGKDHEPAYVAKKITKGVRDDQQKLQVLFDYITTQVQYDTEAFLTGKLKERSLEQVLQDRKGVCQDYAMLFNAMATAVGVQSSIVTGIINAGTDTPDVMEHAWNMVTLNQQTWVIDTTWGAGYFDRDKQQHIQKRDARYFLANPDRLVLTHKPAPTAQAFQHPLSLEEFQRVNANTRLLANLGFSTQGLVQQVQNKQEHLLPQVGSTFEQAIQVVAAPLTKPTAGQTLRIQINHPPNTAFYLRAKGADLPFTAVSRNTSQINLTLKENTELEVVYAKGPTEFYRLMTYR